MTYIHTICAFCGKPVIRKRQARSRNVRLHFCNMDCKSNHQKLAKPVTKEWLHEQYVTLGRNCPDIAMEVKRDAKSVWNWLKGFGIPTRKRGGNVGNREPKIGSDNPFSGKRHSAETKKKMSDIAKKRNTLEFKKKLSEIAKAAGRVPYDPAIGPNGGRRGKDHPSWKGGFTPERIAFYATQEWINAAKTVKKRDKNTCQRCGVVKAAGDGVAFDIHHIVSFACVELRAEVGNLVYLCEKCHYWVHGKENVNRYFIKEIPT